MDWGYILRRGKRLHVIRNIPSGRLAGRPTPAILIPPEDGLVLTDAWRFLTEYPYDHKSHSWKSAAARTIGKFFDFYKAQNELTLTDAARANRLINGFLTALSNGTIQDDGSDPLNLYWLPVSKQVYSQSRTYLKCFVEKLEDFHSDSALKATSFYSIARQARKTEQRQTTSLLYHSIRPSTESRGSTLSFSGVLKKTRRAIEFPEKNLNDFIWIGCRRKKAIRDFDDQDGQPTLASEYNINLMMAISLMAGAGLRKSELFHLFVEDVLPPRRKVYLYHPERGVHRQYSGPNLTRQEYLMKEFGLVSRRRMHGNQKIGWKNLLISDASNERSQCYFLPKWEEFFFKLFHEYRSFVLPDNIEHPYLFVSLDRDNYGKPWTPAALTKQFSAAVKRIGLEPRLELGTTPHGCRHYYGQSLVDMKLSPIIIQECLHHMSITSQLVYTRPTPLKVNNALQQAHSAMASRAEHDPSNAKLDIERGILTGRYKSDPSGVFTQQNLGFGKDQLDD